MQTQSQEYTSLMASVMRPVLGSDYLNRKYLSMRNVTSRYFLLPVIPVGLFVKVIVLDIHILAFPRCLVIGQVSPFNQIVDIPLLIHTEGETSKS